MPCHGWYWQNVPAMRRRRLAVCQGQTLAQRKALILHDLALKQFAPSWGSVELASLGALIERSAALTAGRIPRPNSFSSRFLVVP
jgi:hypothetical protein